MRLDRRLVELGLGSRSEVGRMVRRGRVEVDGVRVTDPAFHLDPGAVVTVDGAPRRPPPVLLAWHKPVGVLSTVGDPWGRANLATEVPAVAGVGWHPVGRLDRDTSGLLLLSRDGALTQHLLHPRRAIEREYVATVDPRPDASLVARLAQGVMTSDGVFPARVVELSGDQVRLVVREGKYRMVRRLLANVGHPVRGLHRLRYGAVEIGELEVGEVAEVPEEIVQRLRGGGDAG